MSAAHYANVPSISLAAGCDPRRRAYGSPKARRPSVPPLSLSSSIFHFIARYPWLYSLWSLQCSNLYSCLEAHLIVNSLTVVSNGKKEGSTWNKWYIILVMFLGVTTYCIMVHNHYWVSWHRYCYNLQMYGVQNWTWRFFL